MSTCGEGASRQRRTGRPAAQAPLPGGVTVVVDQPNTIPPLTTSEAFITRVHEAQAHSLCSFAINSGVSPDTPFEAMWKAGAMAFRRDFCPSSYGKALDAPELSRALGRIRGLGGLATIHAEGIAPGEDTNLAAHDSLRSPEGEREAVIAVQACNPVGCRIHFCHMSTAGAIDAAKGTVEVTPHHLLLSREKTGSADSRFKVNPPVRTEAERRALWTRWERIDIIASDHAPHTKAEKALPFPDAPSGVPGVETMVPLLMAEMIDKRITLTDLVQKTATAPAALIGIPPAGFVTGDRADSALYPRSAVTVGRKICTAGVAGRRRRVPCRLSRNGDHGWRCSVPGRGVFPWQSFMVSRQRTCPAITGTARNLTSPASYFVRYHGVKGAAVRTVRSRNAKDPARQMRKGADKAHP